MIARLTETWSQRSARQRLASMVEVSGSSRVSLQTPCLSFVGRLQMGQHICHARGLGARAQRRPGRL